MLSLIQDIIEQANTLITSASNDDKIIIVIMTIAVLAVIFALLHSIYLLSAKLHSWLVDKEELVLPMLVNSPSRLFILTIFSLWCFLSLLYEMSTWLHELWPLSD